MSSPFFNAAISGSRLAHHPCRDFIREILTGVPLQGVLGVSWSSQDPSLLLSVGKDSRTILWGVGGQKLGEYSSASFNFDVQWSPTNAGVFSTCSYGGGDGQDGTVSAWKTYKTLDAESGVTLAVCLIKHQCLWRQIRPGRHNERSKP